VETFKIIKPTYSKKQRNWFGATNAILSIVLGTLLLWILVPIIKDLDINSNVSMILIIIIAFIIPVIMIMVDKRIINAYSEIGNIEFLNKELLININDNQLIDYKAIKMIYISPLLIFGRGGIIAITIQIIKHDNEKFESQILYKSNFEKWRFLLLNAKSNIFDTLKARKLRYKWIRKKK